MAQPPPSAHACPAPSAPEKGLRLRAAIQLDEAQYRGRRVSRADWEEPDERKGTDLGNPSPVAPSPAHPSSGEEVEEEEEEKGDRDEEAPTSGEEGPDGGWPSTEDADADALEQELAAVAASEAAAVAALRERAKEERVKAVSVAAQRRLWEGALELRIRLQKPLAAAQRLPRAPATRAALKEQAPQTAALLREVAGAAACAASELCELRDILMAAQPGVPPAGKRRKGAVEGSPDGVDVDALWGRLEDGYGRFAPFRDDSLDRWHAKTSNAAGGAAARPGLRALNQAVSQQVAAALRDAPRALRRATRLACDAPALLCEPPQADAEAHANGGDDAAPVPAADAPRDLDCYEDGEFYAQLLKELLEVGGSGAAAPGQAAPAKLRKKVDRRASKGRKLRYTVHPKLVNFMAPVAIAHPPPQTDQLLKRLFGRASTTLNV